MAKMVAPGVYDRNGWKHLDYAGPHGRVREAAGTKDLREAKRLLAERKRDVLAGTWKPASNRVDEGMLLKTWALQWIEERGKLGLSQWSKEKSRIETHIIPALGKTRIGHLRSYDVERFIRKLRGDGKLAPRTIRRIHEDLRVMLKALARRDPDALHGRPWELEDNVLPPSIDKDPKWRAKALFAHSEAERLISDERVPLDRRVLYALLIFTGLRIGEGVGVRWGDIDTSTKPLHRLTLATQLDGKKLKVEGATRFVPIHPTLAAILAEWKLDGWVLYWKRRPTDADWVVPGRRGQLRHKGHSLAELQQDLQTLGMRPRRLHDTRRTFITMGLDADANPVALQRITHKAQQSRDAFWEYAGLMWKSMCAAVSAIDLKRRPTPSVTSISDEKNRTVLSQTVSHGFSKGA
jgi:integrase